MSAVKKPASYWHTPGTRPFAWTTVPQLIDEWAEKKPDAEAYVVRRNGCPREALTFLQLKQETEALAAGLLQLGLKPGDFVLISGITCIHWILVDLACASISVHTVRGRMSALTNDGLVTICCSNNVKAIIYHPGETGEFEEHLMKCIPDAFHGSTDGVVACAAIPSLRHLINMKPQSTTTAAVDVASLILPGILVDEVRELKDGVSSDSLCTVFMSSGSTGFPKAIPFTHFRAINLFRCSRGMHVTMDHGDARFFDDRSMAWIASVIHMPLIFANTNVYVQPMAASNDIDVDFSIQVIHEEKVTSGMFVQYLIIDMTEHIAAGKAQPFRLRSAVTGGDVIPDTVAKMLADFTSNVLFGYGSTECSLTASNLHEDSLDKSALYAGYVEHGTEVKIVNDDGEVVPMGEEGEIVIRSPFAFTGYLQEESKGMAISKDGWINTDDAGSLHGGYLKVFGRKSSVISRGITITFPQVVERLMINFQGVSKVAVIGVPDPRLGENICACVVPKEDFLLSRDDMLKCFADVYTTDEGLGVTPAYFMFMSTFPTVNAKVDRNELRRMAVAEYGL